MNAAVIASIAVGVLVMLLRPPEAGRELLAAPVRAGPSSPVGAITGGSTRLVVSAAAGLVAFLLAPSIWTLVGAPALGAAVWFWLSRMDDRKHTATRQRLAEELPEVLGLLASALSAGSPTRVAVAEVAAVSPADSRGVLETVGSHIRVGRSEQQAWDDIAADPVLAPVWGGPARDLARNATSGAAVVEVLHVHATEARAELRSQVEKQAKTVGIRSVLPLMTCFLPAFVLVGVVPIIAGLISSYLP